MGGCGAGAGAAVVADRSVLYSVLCNDRPLLAPAWNSPAPQTTPVAQTHKNRFRKICYEKSYTIIVITFFYNYHMLQ